MGRRPIDITGQRFGLLVALRPATRRGHWDCACDCGVTVTANTSAMRRGSKMSCGCASLLLPGAVVHRGMPSAVAIGGRFGRLTVREPAANRNGKRRFVCDCDCGGENTVLASVLTAGQTRSCGCLRKMARVRTSPGSGLTIRDLAA